MKAAFYHIFDGVDLPARVNGRLALCVTRIELWPFPHLENEMVSHFTSNDDIIECIIASALIPFALNGKPYVVYRDWVCIDGGMTNIAGVRNYALPSQMDFDEDTTKGDNMHIVPRLRAMLSICSRLKRNLRGVASGEYGMGMPRFRPFAEYPIAVPMALEPFGVYGHGVSIVRSVAHEAYHNLVERAHRLPRAVQERIAAMARFTRDEDCPRCDSDSSERTELGAAQKDAVTVKSVATVKKAQGGFFAAGIVNWIMSKAVPASRSCGTGDSTADSWWVRNEFQIDRHRARIAARALGCKGHSEGSMVESTPADASCACSYSDFSVVEKQSASSTANTTSSSLVSVRNASSPSETVPVDISAEGADHASASTSAPSSCGERSTGSSPSNAGEQNGMPVGGGHVGYDCISREDKLVQRNHVSKKDHRRAYWRKKAEAVSATPCGGTQLLITPWMWRKLPAWRYHLTSRGDKAAALLELGFIDAAEHHLELVKFFNPGDYVKNMMMRGGSS